MRVILVEHDNFYAKLAEREIKRAYPGTQISHFRDVGNLLKTADSLPGGPNTFFRYTDLMISGRSLPLMGRDEDFEKFLGELIKYFDTVVRNWEPSEGGERLVRWMRSEGVDLPVLFWSISGKERFAEDLQADPRICYLKKSTNMPALSMAIRLATAHT